MPSLYGLALALAEPAMHKSRVVMHSSRLPARQPSTARVQATRAGPEGGSGSAAPGPRGVRGRGAARDHGLACGREV